MVEDGKQQFTSIECSIVEAVGEAGTDLAVDFAEMGIDRLLETGKDLPVVGTIRALLQAATGIRDQMFAKKVLNFLLGTKPISRKQRECFLRKVASSKRRRKLGETLMLLLERAESYEKARLLGTVFAAFVKEKLTAEEMLTIARMVDAVDIDDLRAWLSDGPIWDESLCWRLSSIGILGAPRVEVEAPRETTNTVRGVRPKKPKTQVKFGRHGNWPTVLGEALLVLFKDPMYSGPPLGWGDSSQ